MLQITQRLLVQWSLVVALLLLASNSGMAQSGIVAWGWNQNGECNVPTLPAGVSYVDMVTGSNRTIATCSDGSVTSWGANSSVPVLPPGLSYVQFAAGTGFSVALRSDSSVITWYGPGTQVPVLPPAGLTFVKVAAGYYHSMALLSDGSLFGWGDNSQNQLNIPVLPFGMTYTDIRAGSFINVARRSDGSFVAFPPNQPGQHSIPPLPPGLTYLDIAIGGQFMVGRRNDGTLIAWGSNNAGQCNVPALPPGMRYLDVAAGEEFAVARRSDGALVAWGANTHGETTVPAPPGPYDRYSAVRAGRWFALALIEPNDPTTYCTAKTNSLGCTPSISYTGLPSFSGPDDFHVTASNVMNNKAGLMLWSFTPGAVPFLGGTLCLAAPITRTVGQYSGGTAAPAQDCSGIYAYHLSQAYMVTQLLPPATHMFAQYWSRDPGSGPPHTSSNIGLTNALSFVIYP